MQCRVDGCGRDAQYKTAQLCQMHYFRIARLHRQRHRRCHRFRLHRGGDCLRSWRLGSHRRPHLDLQASDHRMVRMTLAEYVAQQWAILREYGLIKGEGE